MEEKYQFVMCNICIKYFYCRYLRRVTCREEWSTFCPDHVTTSQNICLNIKISTPCGILVQQPDHDLLSMPVLSMSRGHGWTLVWPGTGVTMCRVRVRSSSTMPLRSRMSGSPWVTSLLIDITFQKLPTLYYQRKERTENK